MRKLFVLSFFLFACGQTPLEDSSLQSPLRGPFHMISQNPKGFCLDKGKLTIIDHFHNPPDNIVIDVPKPRDCQLTLSGTETLEVSNSFTKGPWEQTNSYNIQIKRSDLNKCLGFGEGGGLMNVSWQKCVDPQTVGDLVKANAQQWTMRGSRETGFLVINYSEFILKKSGAKELCLILDPALPNPIALRTCAANSTVWKFFGSGF